MGLLPRVPVTQVLMWGQYSGEVGQVTHEFWKSYAFWLDSLCSTWQPSVAFSSGWPTLFKGFSLLGDSLINLIHQYCVLYLKDWDVLFSNKEHHDKENQISSFETIAFFMKHCSFYACISPGEFSWGQSSQLFRATH